jgi:hypothetical protein
MTIFAALDLAGLTVADLPAMRALVLRALADATADLLASFGGRS